MSVNRYNPETGKLDRIAGGTVYADAPIGAIVSYGGTEAPRGWLLCDGSAVSRTTYSELFAKIGTAYGAGDGSTTFNVPDLRGEFLRGAGTNSHANQGSGGAVGEHQDATEIPYCFAQSNSMYNALSPSAVPVKEDSIIRNSDTLKMVGANSSSGARSHIYTSRPTNTSVNFIIKSENILVPHDFAEYVRLATTPDWSNAVALTAVQLYAGYTAPANGLIVGYWYQANGNASMEINGIPAGISSAENNIYPFGQVQCPVVIGDIVKTSAQMYGSTVHFVPYKVQ